MRLEARPEDGVDLVWLRNPTGPSVIDTWRGELLSLHTVQFTQYQAADCRDLLKEQKNVYSMSTKGFF